MSEPYYSDESVTIYHGDCREVMADLADDLVDITITSPPYNMGLSPGGNGRGLYGHTTSKGKRFSQDGYDGETDALPPEEYDEFLRTTLLDMWRLSRLAVWWNHRPRIEHGLLKDPLGGVFPLPVGQRIILARPTGIDVSLRRFVTRQEHLYLFAKDGFRLTDHATSGMGDVWPMPIPPKGEHPAPFDLSVPARCIAATADVELILDPFCGSGTTLRAAKDAGLRATGIERSERFCEMAAERCGGPVRVLADGFDFGGAA